MLWDFLCVKIARVRYLMIIHRFSGESMSHARSRRLTHSKWNSKRRNILRFLFSVTWMAVFATASVLHDILLLKLWEAMKFREWRQIQRKVTIIYYVTVSFSELKNESNLIFCYLKRRLELLGIEKRIKRDRKTVLTWFN